MSPNCPRSANPSTAFCSARRNKPARVPFCLSTGRIPGAGQRGPGPGDLRLQSHDHGRISRYRSRLARAGGGSRSARRPQASLGSAGEHPYEAYPPARNPIVGSVRPHALCDAGSEPGHRHPAHPNGGCFPWLTEIPAQKKARLRSYFPVQSAFAGTRPVPGMVNAAFRGLAPITRPRTLISKPSFPASSTPKSPPREI
jgi:hypothetical protein